MKGNREKGRKYKEKWREGEKSTEGDSRAINQRLSGLLLPMQFLPNGFLSFAFEFFHFKQKDSFI